MARAAWPTTGELEAYLTSLGASLPGGISAQGLIDGAVEEVEALTGPLFEVASASYTYDPPRGHDLWLGCWFSGISAVSLDGSALDATAWFARPINGPFYRIQFYNPVYGNPGALSVTGTKGYGDTIPEKLWQAVLQCAAIPALAAGQIGGSVLGPIQKVKQGGVEVTGGTSTTMSAADMLRAEAKKEILKYRAPRPFIAGGY